MKWLLECIKNNERVNLDMVIERNGHDFPLLKEMKNTEQDPVWHPEGNVHIHTDMVIDCIYDIFDSEKLTIDEKYILLMGAIFHDIGKPLTSKWKEVRGENHLTAAGHEIAGSSYIFYRFNELDIKFKDQILEIVSYHQKPKLLVIKDIVCEWQYKILTSKISGKLLYLFSLADLRGRTSLDRYEQIFYLEMFKEYCIEHNCYDSTSGLETEIKNYFKQNHSVFDENSLNYLFGKSVCRLFENESSIDEIAYKYYENKINYATFYLMCGISGSGKTTFIRDLQKKHDDLEIIELDKLRSEHKLKSNNRREIDGRVLQDAKLLIKRALADKRNVVLDACNIRKDFRDVFLDLAESYYALTHIVLIDIKMSTAINNDKNRGYRYLGEDIIFDQIKKFQIPERTESNLFSVVCVS